MLDDEFVENLPDDPIGAVQAIYEKFEQFKKAVRTNPGNYEDVSDQSLQFLSLMTVIVEKFDINHLRKVPAASGVENENTNNTIAYFKTVYTWIQEERSKKKLSGGEDRFRVLLANTFSYEFSDDETTRINQLISELREIISKSELFEEGHKQRLLRRLERLQSEVHKKVSDLDRFWGLVGDAGVALRKFGEDARPIVDRVREITQIIWGAQAKAEGLPASDTIPLLTKSDEPD